MVGGVSTGSAGFVIQVITKRWPNEILLKQILGKVQIGSNIAQNTYCLYDVISGHKQLTTIFNI